MLRNLGAIIAGFVVSIISIILVRLVIGFIIEIPILGPLLTYPVDAGWFMGVALNTIPLENAFGTAKAIEKDAWAHKTLGWIFAVFYVWSIISLIINKKYVGISLIFQIVFMLIGIVMAYIMIQEDEGPERSDKSEIISTPVDNETNKSAVPTSAEQNKPFVIKPDTSESVNTDTVQKRGRDLYCRNCGSLLRPEDKYCRNCGANVVTSNDENAQEEK